MDTIIIAILIGAVLIGLGAFLYKNFTGEDSTSDKDVGGITPPDQKGPNKQ